MRYLLNSNKLSDIDPKRLPKPNPKFNQVKSEYLQIALTAFVTVFLAELGDKTQLTTLMITAQSSAPLVVFLGAALALVLSSFLGVIGGRWIAKTISPQFLDNAAGLSFLLLALGLLWDAIV